MKNTISDVVICPVCHLPVPCDSTYDGAVTTVPPHQNKRDRYGLAQLSNDKPCPGKGRIGMTLPTQTALEIDR